MSLPLPAHDKPQPDEDDLLLIEEDELLQPLPSAAAPAHPSPTEISTWKIIIVDDEPDVHRATELALKNLQFENKSLSFISAFSAAEGKHVIQSQHADAAIMLLDVVMETQDAGLKVVQFIRDELQNHQVRIILRTGQPGEAPEDWVIMNYDINDYKLKVELTRQRMLTSTVAALRSYRDIMTIEQQRQELAQTLEQLQTAQRQLEDYTRTLETRVAQRTAALEVANNELQKIADLDGLTRIANRRRCDQYLQQHWQSLGQNPLSLILLDVDYFKDYNDHYGHQAGDECLRKIAQAISAVPIRSSDLVARYGGEEFLVALVGSPFARACQVAEQIMEQIHALHLPHARSLISDQVTISLGVTSVVATPQMSLEAAIAMADQALYQAKQKGRDRYCIALPDSVSQDFPCKTLLSADPQCFSTG